MNRIKLYMSLLVVIMMTACNNSSSYKQNYSSEIAYFDTITNSEFNGWMNRYFKDFISYPKNGEEFCRKFYLQDSINGFDFISSWCSYSGNDKDYLKHNLSNYQQYNQLLNKYLYEAYHYKGAFFTPINSYLIPYLTKVDWQYIYQYRSYITFSTEDDKLMMKNAADHLIFKGENYFNTLPRYMNDKHSLSEIYLHINLDIRRIGELNTLRQTYAYTADSIRIELQPEFIEVDDKGKVLEISSWMQKKINTIIKNNYSTSVFNDKKTRIKYYILQYKKSGEMTDFFTGESAPTVITNNKELKDYLNSIFPMNSKISFVQFSAFTIS
ncbi:MAG: hypothetical protein IKN15_08420 [Bacteroidaceae bacterium]|nr:hypothetical protein [Bacteroidaceae bacterium]